MSDKDIFDNMLEKLRVLEETLDFLDRERKKLLKRGAALEKKSAQHEALLCAITKLLNDSRVKIPADIVHALLELEPKPVLKKDKSRLCKDCGEVFMEGNTCPGCGQSYFAYINSQ